MMSWQFTPYLLLITLAALLTASLAIYAWYHRKTPGAVSLFFLFASAALWSFFYALEVASATLEGKLFWIRFEYIGIVAVPVAWLIFASIYTKRTTWSSPTTYVLLAIIPLLTLLFLWTNPFHNLFYTSIGLTEIDGIQHFDPTYGPWFWAHTIFSYMCYLAGSLLLVRHIFRLDGVYQRQAIIVFLGSIPPFLVSFLFVFAPTPLDPAPIAFAVSAVLFAWGFFRLGLMNMLPDLMQPIQTDKHASIDSSVMEARERVLDLVLLINTGMATLLLVLLIIFEFRKPELTWGNILIYLVVYLGVILLTVLRDLPFNLRAGLLLLLYYLFSLFTMSRYGLNIDIGVAMFAFVIMAFLFYGVWGGIYAVVLSLLTLGAGVWLIITGQLTIQSPYVPGGDPIQILLAPFGFLYSTGIVILALLSQQRDTLTVLNQAQGLSQELEQERLLLERRVAERTHALEIGAQVSRRISTILDQDQLVNAVVNQVRDAFDYYHVHIYLYDDSSTHLVMAGGTGAAGHQMLTEGHTIEPGKGLVSKAATTQEAVIVSNVHDEPDWLPNPFLPQTSSEVAVPIQFRGEVLGVLDVQDNVAGGMGAEDAVLLQTIANQVAVALRNARLYAETQKQAEELVLVNRVVSAVAASLDLRQNMQIIVDELAQAINVEQVGIALLNPERDALTVVAEHFNPDVSPSAVGFVIPLVGNLSSQQVIATRKTVIVEDAQHNPMTATAHEVMRQRGVETLVIMPILVGDEVAGTLGIDLLKGDAPLTADQLRLAETLLFQAATAVQSTRLFERTQAALAETDSLYQSSAKLNRAQSFDDILDIIRQHTIIGQQADLMAYTLFDHPWQPDQMPAQLHIVGRWSAKPAQDIVWHYKVADVPNINLLHSDKPLIIENISTDPRLDARTRKFLQQPDNLESALFAPLVVGRRWIGFIGLFCAESIQFEEADVRRLLGLVGQSAVAGQTLVLLEEAQTALTHQAYLTAQLRTVSEVGTSISTLLDLDELLQSVVDLTRDQFNLYHAHIYLLDFETNALQLRAGAGEVGREMARVGRRVDLDTNFIVAQCARRREAVLVNDTRADSDFLHHPLLPETRAGLAVPILLGDTLLGVLGVQARTRNRFSADDVQVQKTLASQVAVAVQNAYLYAEQLETSTKLRTVDRLKTEFLASMSHELRTPLNSIIGFADVLLSGMDGELTERMEEDVDLIRTSGYHLRDLIGDILDMSKIEAGRVELHYETINIRKLFEDVVNSARISADKKDIALEYCLEDDIKTIVADRTCLRQILWNIVGNAIKFTDEGSVKINAHMQDNEFCCFVHDTGIGIHAEDIPIVFEQFRQIDASKTTPQRGTGLGMPISKRLVELHGGQIGLESHPGTGTTFWFTIPQNGAHDIDK